MKNYISMGGMPHKVDEPLNLQQAFTGLTRQVLVRMFEILSPENSVDYPYSNYTLDDGSDGNNEFGIQLTIESDVFGTDQIMLRRHSRGYTLAILSMDDNIGSLDYEFLEDDPLVDLIPMHVQDYMSDNYI